jgi:hypothetical protein
MSIARYWAIDWYKRGEENERKAAVHKANGQHTPSDVYSKSFFNFMVTVSLVF